jgi:hypothetical protein
VNAARRKLLVLGSSGVEHPADRPELSLPNLVLERLQAAQPERLWELETGLLYPTTSMPARAAALIEKHRPEAALFICSAVFAEETVVFSIRKRWPRLYRPATRLAALFEGPAGEPGSAGSSMRSALYSRGRRIAAAVAGKAPMVTLEEAVTSTAATLRELAAHQGVALACRLTCGSARDDTQRSEVRRRIDEFNRLVAAECRELGIGVIDLVGEMAAAGLEYTLEADKVHGDLAARTFCADRAAALLVEALSRVVCREPG